MLVHINFNKHPKEIWKKIGYAKGSRSGKEEEIMKSWRAKFFKLVCSAYQ
jgi:hypothetical protein